MLFHPSWLPQDSKVVTKGRFKCFGSLTNADQVFEIGNWHAEVDKQLTAEDFKWVGGGLQVGRG